MQTVVAPDLEKLNQIKSEVAKSANISSSRILLFNDVTDTLQSILSIACGTSSLPLTVAGIATADLMIAADRADMSINEVIGASPYSVDLSLFLEEIEKNDIVYLSNPNRISGTSWSLNEINEISEKLSDGLLIVDEYYADFLGIKSESLISNDKNIITIRSFTSTLGVGTESGYLMSNQEWCNKLSTQSWCKISQTQQNMISMTLQNSDVKYDKLKKTHDEILRIVKALSEIKIQCRIIPTDFLLLRVAQPEKVCNFLASNNIPIENLDGYPAMNNYLRYFIQSELSNDQFIRVMQRMPKDYFEMKTKDNRPIRTLKA